MPGASLIINSDALTSDIWPFHWLLPLNKFSQKWPEKSDEWSSVFSVIETGKGPLFVCFGFSCSNVNICYYCVVWDKCYGRGAAQSSENRLWTVSSAATLKMFALQVMLINLGHFNFVILLWKIELSSTICNEKQIRKNFKSKKSFYY